MFNILVVEDDVIQRKRLVQVLKNINSSWNIFEADSVKKAVEIAKEQNIDLFYIDMNLKDGYGIDLASKIREMEIYEFSWIVFVSAYSDQMLKAFKRVHCYDYVLKPYADKNIIDMTKKLLTSREHKKRIKEKRFLIFDSGNITIRIYFNDILFIESQGKDCIIHTVNGEYEVKRKSIRRIAQLTRDSRLKQTHRSFIVNIDRVEKVDRTNSSWEIHFEGYDKIALIGSTYHKKLEELIEKEYFDKCI